MLLTSQHTKKERKQHNFCIFKMTNLGMNEQSVSFNVIIMIWLRTEKGNLQLPLHWLKHFQINNKRPFIYCRS